MPARSDRRNEKSLRGLLLLFAVFVLIAIIAAVITATKKPATSAGSTSNSTAAAQATTTTAGGKVHTSPPKTATPTTAVKDHSSTASKATAPTTRAKTAPTTDAKSRPTTTIRTTPTTASTTYVLYNVHSSGDNALGFTIIPSAGEWDVTWGYNCGKAGRFDYTIKRAARPDAKDLGPHELGTSGSGVTRYRDTGAFTLSVASQCLWAIKVTEVIYG
jgi:hypothetical protein